MTRQRDPIAIGKLKNPVLKYGNQCYNASSLFHNNRALARDPMTNEPFSPTDREEIRTTNGSKFVRQDGNALSAVFNGSTSIYQTSEMEELEKNDTYIVNSYEMQTKASAEEDRENWFIRATFSLKRLAQFGRFVVQEGFQMPETCQELIESTDINRLHNVEDTNELDYWYNLFKMRLGERATIVYGMDGDVGGCAHWEDAYAKLRDDEYVRMAFFLTRQQEPRIEWTPFIDTTFGELRSCATCIEGEYGNVEFEWGNQFGDVVSDSKEVLILNEDERDPDDIEAILDFMGMPAVIS